ncbi:MAG: VWA domain-containing protein, partial [Candidatus Binatia bacterium]
MVFEPAHGFIQTLARRTPGGTTVMKNLLANIEFARPYFLWLLLLLPVIWLRLGDRRLWVLLARSVILALVILTLADPQTTSQQSRQEERVFAYDVSRSVPPSMRPWMESTTKQLAPGNSDRIYTFAAAAKESANLKEALSDDASASQPDKTNLENLLTSLLALPAAPRSVFLFTDGWETDGDVERLLPAAAAAGIKIYPMLPAERPAIANVAVTRVIAPSQGMSGELLKLKVSLDNQNDREVAGVLTLTRNGQPFKTDRIKLRPGSQSFSYQANLVEGALTAYRASFAAVDAAADIFTPDNHALAWVNVRTKAKVLIVNGAGGSGRYLDEIARRQGFDVVSSGAEGAPPPAGHKVVIFNNVPRERFSAAYLASVESHVAGGGSFIMLGADASFAQNSYRQTAIEKILPVEPKEPPKQPEKNRAVVLVIDKSGSMRDDNRILYAKEAAKAVARQLKDIDLLGVVGFDDSPFVVVYLESMARLRGVIDSQIDRLRPGGQTYFLPALQEARRQLERSNASRKHVILISDGVTRGSQGELVDLIGVMKNDSKITVSAVAVSNDADVRIMKRVAQYGGGLFHQTFDPSTLPQIVLEQLQDKPRDEPKDNRPLIPIQPGGSELLAGFDVKNYPAVLGYMETEIKRGAQADLIIPRDDRRAPLLASWRYGKGKSVAFTSDLEGRWTRNWVPWGGLQGLWGRILEWLSPSSEKNLIPLHEARVNFTGGQSILDLTVYEESSANSQFRFSLSGKSGKTDGTLTKLAPGHFQVVLPANSSGDYRIDLTEERAGQRIAYPPVAYTLAYDRSAEVPRPEFNYRLLARLAEGSGGEINPRSLDSLRRESLTKNFQPLRQPLLVLAFVLL